MTEDRSNCTLVVVGRPAPTQTGFLASLVMARIPDSAATGPGLSNADDIVSFLRRHLPAETLAEVAVILHATTPTRKELSCSPSPGSWSSRSPSGST